MRNYSLNYSQISNFVNFIIISFIASHLVYHSLEKQLNSKSNFKD